MPSEFLGHLSSRRRALSIALALAVVTMPTYGITETGASLAAHEVRTIVLTYGSCFASCPSYELSFASDGGVTYHGLMFTRGETYRMRIDEHRFMRAVGALDRYGLLVPRYRSPSQTGRS